MIGISYYHYWSIMKKIQLHKEFIVKISILLFILVLGKTLKNREVTLQPDLAILTETNEPLLYMADRYFPSPASTLKNIIIKK